MQRPSLDGLPFFDAEQIVQTRRSRFEDVDEQTDPGSAARGGDPGDLRGALASYVAAVHEAYLDAGGGDDGHGLAAAPFTVVAAAASSLHLVATSDEVEAPARGTAEPVEEGSLTWQLKFLDPSILPELGDIPAGPDEPPAVQAVVGVEHVLYHLVVGQGSALTGHHAMHTGTGIAHREQQRRGDAS